jgi:AI-2 transport protein TqsA
MSATSEPGGVLRIVVILAGVLVILAGIQAAASIVGPLLLAIFFSILFGKLMRWLEKKGAPHWAALAIAIVSFIGVIAGFFFVIAASLFQMVAQMPGYQSDIEGTLASMAAATGVPVPQLSSLISALSDFTVSAVSGIVSSVSAVALVTLTTLFLLFEVDRFSAKIGVMLAPNPAILERFTSFGEKIVDYVVIRTEVNVATGVGIGLVIAAVGLEYAAVWGFLAFALSFIPYVGFWLAVVPPMLIAWSTLGPTSAVIILVGAVIINTLAEYILFPQVAGKGLDQSPAVVFVSLVLWGYVLGSLGALLAVPLTLALVLFLGLFDETRWICVLLSPSVPETPEPEPEQHAE